MSRKLALQIAKAGALASLILAFVSLYQLADGGNPGYALVLLGLIAICTTMTVHFYLPDNGEAEEE